VVRARAADEGFDEAFPALFMAAFRVTLRLLGSVHDAEDAAAEAVARALVGWARVGRLPHREAWVARVAANVALDQLRRRQPPVMPAAQGIDPAEQAALRLALAAALRGLSRRQRQVVVLRYLADIDETEVARSLGISVNSVKTHTLRALAALRRHLGPTWQEVSLVVE
jgi:RNA polymerase sigma factor (sigma-70 family)